MTRSTRNLSSSSLAAAAGAGCLFLSEKVSLTAAAIAGVDRRRARRPPAHADELCRRGSANDAPRGGGGAVAAPVVVAPVPVRRCVQVVDAYGRIVTRC